jgi:predicted dehydrogenase
MVTVTLLFLTGFFRDPDVFEALKKQVFANLTKNRPPANPIRIWVPGCSTGEEPYSISIAIAESPAFGRAVAFHGTHLAPGEFVTGPGGRGGGSLGWRFMLDQGCHMADCARFLMGPVRSVTAAASTASARGDQFGLSALLAFDGGATGTLLFASHASVMSPSVTVVGGAGQAVTVHHLVSLERYPLPDDLGDPALRARVTQTWAHGANYRGVSRPGHLEALEHFARAIGMGAAPAPSLDDGWRAMRLCEAMLESAEGGRPVALAGGG